MPVAEVVVLLALVRVGGWQGGVGGGGGHRGICARTGSKWTKKMQHSERILKVLVAIYSGASSSPFSP